MLQWAAGVFHLRAGSFESDNVNAERPPPPPRSPANCGARAGKKKNRALVFYDRGEENIVVAAAEVFASGRRSGIS